MRNITEKKEKLQFWAELTSKQAVAWEGLARDDIKEVLYGGAKVFRVLLFFFECYFQNFVCVFYEGEFYF